MIDSKLAFRLVQQSNRIEGILRRPYKREVEEFLRFISVPRTEMSILELIRFVRVFQPDAVLRNRPGANVYIGNHRPRMGGPMVEEELRLLLDEIKAGKLDPWTAHMQYEHLHPFTDGNGRSGRALWVWHMIQTGKAKLLGRPELFLHSFYYDTLSRFHELR